jgi:hypothetical protein
MSDQGSNFSNMNFQPQGDPRGPRRSGVRPLVWIGAVCLLILVVVAGVILYDMGEKAPDREVEPPTVSKIQPEPEPEPERDYQTELPGVAPEAEEPEEPAEPAEQAEAAEPEAADEGQESVVTGEITPPGEEPDPAADAASRPGEMVTPEFVSDLAAFAVRAYEPAGTQSNPTARPMTGLTYKTANMRYGTALSLFGHQAADARSARAQVFSYLFRPGVVRAVYGFYVDEFIEAMQAQAVVAERTFKEDGEWVERSLTPAEIASMFTLYADQAAGGAQVYRALANDPSPLSWAEDYLQAEKDVRFAYEKFTALMADDTASEASRERASEAMRAAITEREEIKARIAGGIKAEAGQALSDDAMLYLTMWAHRRIEDHPERKELLGAMATVLDDLALRMNQVAQSYR